MKIKIDQGVPLFEGPDANVESGIPIPPRLVRPLGFPFHLMEVGESVLVRENASGARLASWRDQRDRGSKFLHRSVDGGVRFWRVK